MLNDERESIFSGAIMIVMFQIIYLAILTNHFMNPKAGIQKADNFTIMIPRVLSCIMMHMIVVPDLRQGLRIMKFVIKHPWYFKVIDETPEIESESEVIVDREDKTVVQGVISEVKEADVDQETGMLRRALCAFLLGFFQFSIACTAQILIILLLFKQTDVVAVMVKFVAFSGVTKFDDFYAANMTENPIKKTVGKKLWFHFTRK